MNLAKVALYLEYIAFMLRWHFAPNPQGVLMSKPATPANPSSPGTPPDAPAVPKGAIVTNADVLALNSCCKALQALEPDDRDRVLSWLNAKFQRIMPPKQYMAPHGPEGLPMNKGSV